MGSASLRQTLGLGTGVELSSKARISASSSAESASRAPFALTDFEADALAIGTVQDRVNVGQPVKPRHPDDRIGPQHGSETAVTPGLLSTCREHCLFQCR